VKLIEIVKDDIEELTKKESKYIYDSQSYSKFLKEVYNNNLLDNIIYNSKLLYNYIEIIKKDIHLNNYIAHSIVEKSID
jgi:hypothetical protein